MRKILFFCLYLIAISSALAQHTLTGRVIHGESREPVIGATVFIPELRSGASTDVNGDFRLTNLPSGSLTVQVSYVAHKTVIQKVQLTGSQKVDFVMENAVNSLEEVIVSGSSTKTIIKESPIPIAALSKIQWLQTPSTNLIDAVAKLPGMSQISTGVGLSKPIIRGLGFNRVITMHDGVRQEDNQWGEEHSIQVDEYSIDRYEIIRGAGSLMYGSDGLGGVMSILSPRPVEEGKIVGRVLGQYLTNNNMLGLSAQVAGNKNGFVWLLQTSRKDAKNYRNPEDGRVYGSSFIEPFNFNGYIGLNKKWGYTRLHFLRSFQRFNIVTGTRNERGQFTKTIARNDTTEADVPVSESELNRRVINPANSQNLYNYKVSLNNYVQMGESSMSLNVSYAQNRRLEYANVFRPGVADLYFYLQTGYYDARYNLAPRKNWETTIGTNGMYQTLTNRGFETLYPNYELFDNGVFVFTKKSYERLKISGGVRYDLRMLNINRLYIDTEGRFQPRPTPGATIRFAGFEKSYQNISGSLGGVYNLTPQWTVRANISRGFRAPTVPELSSNGEHAGTFRYEIGNLKAIPEVAVQGDLGTTYDGKSVYADFSIFQNSIRNYTYSERVQTRMGADSIIDGVPVFRYTQGNARLQGLEATVTLNPAGARWFSLTQSFSSVFARNLSARTDDAKFLPFMPAPRWITQVRLTKDRWKGATGEGGLRNVYISADLEVNQQQNRVLLAYNTETPTPAYTLFGLGFGGDVVGRSKQTLFSVYVASTNLFDVSYQSHQSRLKYLDVNPATGRRGVYGMGRNVSVRLVIPFEGRL
ncbi:TonB-dependent receptor [Tellurirhabdus rosea]|uniref:TonB-dependent receptor n=1 Tax=Tellurirhabdus rosea TaxID=2674997 RepID=UPI0022541C63|nr:TonB-dependent receptor [Tellurirhabdus rosea]